VRPPEISRIDDMNIPVTAALAAFCGLLLVGLASRVSSLRMRHKVPFGDGGHTDLMRAIRVHANTTEHAPIFVLMTLAWELMRGPTGFLVAIAATFALARAGFAAAILGRGLHQLRMLTAALTYLCQAVLAAALLVAVLAR
jgi:uncharacterized membrane protein YecN with MAPEG domain